MKKIKELLFILLFASLTLAGCSVQSVKKDFSFSDASNEGIVILSVSHDLSGGRGTRAIFYMDGIPVHGGKMLFSLDDAFPGIPRGSDFADSYGHIIVMSLPAGKHFMDSWQVTIGSAAYLYPRRKPVPLEFEVRKGEIVYLGNLHANLYTGKNLFGMSVVGDGYPEVRDERERDLPMIEEKYPQFKGKVAVHLLPLGPWVKIFDEEMQTPAS